MLKKCSTCKIEKELSNFTKDKNKKDGLKINCRECSNLQNKKYCQENKEEISKRQKIYNKETRIIDKEAIKKYKHEYYKQNKEEIERKKREYVLANKERLNKIRRENIVKRINNTIGGSIRKYLKSINKPKRSRTFEILGCPIDNFKLYLESKFEPWMNWENYGKYNGDLNHGWDIDHIIPITSAKTEEDVYKLNHYSNFQPLCSYTNRYIKKDLILYNI